ncbi:glycosyltransferase family 4 protein [Halobacterium salinarum]|uniref:glycosyltransferase family 4 protein n=1 Tax=Halobacterium salinarum TaxID=2242 RepID=UPI002552AC88|nr:glycosyltransferase family 4 protein [Halobacterium salinarum]MDL0137061.1 glycosyltransferase family 4 protein [Halobacterium salinarum]MDL0140635.1 glycosyltransferase family 4 protein [Halobacterium salinarum]
MRIALLHPASPTAEGSGAVHSATLIGESLHSLGHEVVFYCPEAVDEGYSKVNTRELDIESSAVKNKYSKINERILALADELGSFDIFHSYLMRTIPSVGKISTNYSVTTVVTLNAYGALCPKNDLLYENEENCRSNGPLRCTSCVYNSMRELPPKPDHGSIYRGGRVLHHTIKNMKSYPIISETDKFKENINAFQALSSRVKKIYSDFGYHAKDINVIPNILDEKFEKRHESDFLDPVRLLYVGELKKHKGVDRLPAVLRNLNARGKREFKLSVVGKGPFEKYLVEEIQEKNLTDSISVEGFVAHDALPSVYANHDLFVYPGRWHEPFGRVFLESLAAGTPVVSTDVGAAAEIIGGAGEVGEDIDELTDLILSLTSVQLQNYSEQATSEAKKFDRDVVVGKIDNLYKKID